jgi:hypothetical protein
MLFMETTAVCYENHNRHTNKFCGQKAEVCYAEGGGTYSNLWILMC